MQGPDDVLQKFKQEFGLDSNGRIDAIGLFAFGIVQRDCCEWRTHLHETTGNAPKADQIRKWYESRPPEYFEEVSRIAGQWFTEFSRELLKLEIEEQRRLAIKDALGGPWANFGYGNLVGVTSNFLFSIVLAIFFVLGWLDVSLLGEVKKRLDGSAQQQQQLRTPANNPALPKN